MDISWGFPGYWYWRPTADQHLHRKQDPMIYRWHTGGGVWLCIFIILPARFRDIFRNKKSPWTAYSTLLATVSCDTVMKSNFNILPLAMLGYSPIFAIKRQASQEFGHDCKVDVNRELRFIFYLLKCRKCRLLSAPTPSWSGKPIDVCPLTVDLVP